jgi:hypothetical protein
MAGCHTLLELSRWLEGIPGPFLLPTNVHLTYGLAIDRLGSLSDCVSSFSAITCREF